LLRRIDKRCRLGGWKVKLITRKFAKGELLCSLFILAYFVVIGILTPGLNPMSRLFPAIIVGLAIPVGILGVLTVFNQDLFNLFSGTAEKQKMIPKKEHEEVGLTAQLASMGWMLLYVVLFFVLGPLLALVIAPLLAMRYFGRMKWPAALALMAGTWLFVYLIFVVLVEADLPPGMIFALFS